MIAWLSWRTFSSRWQVFAGTFLALTFGVALMATTLLCIAGTQVANDQDDWLLSVAVTLLGNAAGVSGAAAIFVVAGTFSFAVAQRRREFALLRAVGATPKQVRHLVMGEAFIIGLAAAIAGCVLGVAIAPFFAGWMAGVELAPVSFAPYVTWWPLAIAAATGLLSALLSAWLAARRAGKVAPAEAFMDASVDRRTMTLARWLGAAVFLTGAALVAQLVIAKAHTGIGAAYALLEILMLIFGVMLLVPVFAVPLIRFAALPLRMVTGRLARANTITSLRRTSSMVAPIFITMSLAAAALSCVATLAGIHSTAAKERITAPLVITPDNEDTGLSPQAITAFQQAGKGTVVEPVAQDSVTKVQGSTKDRDRLTALYVRPTIGNVMRFGLTAGDMADLKGSATVAVDHATAAAQGWQVGQTIQLWLPDGAQVSPKIVAIMQAGNDFGATVLLPDELRRAAAPDVAVQVAYAAPAQDMTPAGLAALLQPVANAYRASVVTFDDFLTAQNAQDARIDQVALFTVVGLAVLYTALSIANTCIMAITGRFRDFAVLRLGGATPGQVLGMVVIETCLVTFVALVGAAVVTAGALAIIKVNPETPQIVLPWVPILATAVACLAIALVASIVSVLWAFRTPAIRVAAARE